MSNERKFLIWIGVVTLLIVAAGAFFFSRGQNGETSSSGVSFAEILKDSIHTKGEATTEARIVEFGDYQCPACGQAQPILKKFLEEKGDKVYFVFKNFPLTQIHPNAVPAARAAEAAGKQGKYFEMNEILYQKQAEWSGLADATRKFEEYARSLGLDLSRFKKDINEAIGVINSDAALGKKAGVGSTPTFFINGKMYSGVLSLKALEDAVKGKAK